MERPAVTPFRNRPVFRIFLFAAVVLSPALRGEPTVLRAEVVASEWESVLRGARLLRSLPAAGIAERSLPAEAAFSGKELFRAALIASGVEHPPEIARHLSEFDRWHGELAARIDRRDDEVRQARQIHEFLHRRAFHGGYRAEATCLAELMETGRFNCVSSAVCFLALARGLELPAEAVELPGHALIELRTSRGAIDVETTCGEWFRVWDDPDGARAMVRRVTGFEHAVRQPRRPLADLQLLALIHYNRGVELLARREYREAVAANLRALRLDPENPTARGNLLATLNNWALAVDREGRHAEALDLLERAILLVPDHENFLANEVHIHQNRMEALLAEGRWREALRQIDRAAGLRPREPFYEQARWYILQRQAEQWLLAGDEQAVGELFRLARQTYSSRPELLELERGVWNRAAVRRFERRDYRAALEVIERGLEQLPHDATLENNRLAFLAHWVAEALDRGDFETARRRALHGFSHPEELPEQRRALWRHCLESEQTAGAARP